MSDPKTLLLFDFDGDQHGFAHHAQSGGYSRAGFDLFRFPSNVRLFGFDLTRFVDRLAARAKRAGWQAVVSNNEQFGALAAALLAERMGWPGTSPEAVIACQHKLYARQVLQSVCPEANVPFGLIDAKYGAPVPADLPYPVFVKPVKAAFSVLAREVSNHAALFEHTRFGAWERWVIEKLVEPFDRVARARMPGIPTAHRLMWEKPVHAPQFNLDGYVWQGEVRLVGIVDAIMYPGTQAFMRFDCPSRLPAEVQARALAVATKFLQAVGFHHGAFNMEFFYDPETDAIRVIEFNPRMAGQMSDLYRRVAGVDLHALTLALAHGQDPALLPPLPKTGNVTSSFVYRSFSSDTPVHTPSSAEMARFWQAYPDSLLTIFPSMGSDLERKWLGSHRYAVMHLAGRNEQDLESRCRAASQILGWPAPYADASSAKLGSNAVPSSNPQVLFPHGDYPTASTL